MSIVSAIVKDARAFKAELLKVAAKAPAVVAEIDKEAPEVTALVSLAYPGAAGIESGVLAVTDAVESALAKTGTAATSNGMNVAQDQGVIAAVEALAKLVKGLI